MITIKCKFYFITKNKMRSAKELCAMLITRGISTLTEDEEDVVVDYLEDIGVEVELDQTPKQLCVSLLQKSMEQELGRRVPITAYANSLIQKEKVAIEKKIVQKKMRQRKVHEKELEDKYKTLPGCIPDEDNIVSRNIYELVVDDSIGIKKLSDGSLQYTASISVPEEMYRKIFLNIEKPIIEITTIQGEKGYARIESAHKGDNILISPLFAMILKLQNVGNAFLRLCIHLPDINKINFTYYGTNEELQYILPQLINKLPSVINAFSYLSLGLLLKTNINGKDIIVRVDGLEDSDGIPIFAGLIPTGESDIPFDVDADL